MGRKKTVPGRSVAPEPTRGFDFQDTQYSEQKLAEEGAASGLPPSPNLAGTFTGTEQMNDYESNASLGRN